MRYLHLPIATFSKLVFCFLLTGLIFSGCDTVSESGNRAEVTLQFQTIAPSSTNGNISARLFQQAGDTLRIEGTNGTLLINDIRLIVDDFAFERVDGECESIAKEDDCEEFEAELFFVDLPLNGEPLKLNTSPIKKGLYAELEFEVDDLEPDEEEDAAEEQRKEALLAKIRNEFGFEEWPEAASMVIGGSFINNQGERDPFYTFASAEIDLEMEFSAPLEVKDNTVNRLLTVKINPEHWFKRQDGSVINLRSFDYPSTGEILEFEVEMEEGFVDVEIEED